MRKSARRRRMKEKRIARRAQTIEGIELQMRLSRIDWSTGPSTTHMFIPHPGYVEEGRVFTARSWSGSLHMHDRGRVITIPAFSRAVLVSKEGVWKVEKIEPLPTEVYGQE